MGAHFYMCSVVLKKCGECMFKNTVKNIGFDLIVPRMKVSHYEQFYKMCTDLVAEHTPVPSNKLYEGLTSKMRLERSLIGGGLLMADMRVNGIQEPFAMLVTLDQDVDFKAPDGVPVNVASVLLSPARDGNMHLSRVFRLTRLLKNDDLRNKLVEAKDEAAIQSLLLNPDGWMIAA